VISARGGIFHVRAADGISLHAAKAEVGRCVNLACQFDCRLAAGDARATIADVEIDQ